MDGMQMNRRGLFKAGGALVVGFALAAPRDAAAWTEKPVALD
jgi:nicotinate dehydrogenase subunit B